MNNTFKSALIIILLLLILTPTLLFADIPRDKFYDVAGFDPNRETFAMVPYEHIDTFTGGLILTFIDARIPGNGALDLVIQRTFNSKNVCEEYGGGSPFSCGTIGENSWMGLGWTMHFGRVIDPFGTNPVIEMPDGSRHKTYRYKNDTTKKITKDYWIFDPGVPKTLTLTDGRKIYFEHEGPSVGSNPTLYATKITDTNGNEINIVYKNPYANDEIIDYVEDTAGRRYYFSTSAVNNGQKLTRISGPGVDFTYTHESIPNNTYSRLIDAEPPVGDSWTYSYGSMNELTGVTSPGGGIISYPEYDLQLFEINGQNRYFWVLKKRQTSGRDIPSGTWNFTYQSGASSDTTTISDPCGRTITYKHYGYGHNSTYGDVWKIGLLIQKSITGEETINYTWDKSEYISDEIDSSPFDTDTAIWVPQLTSRSITRGGNTYTTNYSNYDFYGNPGNISESGDRSRTTSISYWYNTSKNIVRNKPSSETVSGDYSGSFTTGYSYNSNGDLTQLNKYGVTTGYNYYSNGNLQSETDANGNTTSYEWDKGIIDKITTPEYSINRVINTDGAIASETNGRGYTTYFKYDGNLRLTEIDPPAGNTTYITYPSNNSYKKETRGSFYTYYYYDGFGRPTGSLNSKGVDTDIVYKSCGLKNYSDSEIGDKVYYDNFGRIKQAVHKDGEDINYSYSGSNVTMTNETGGSAAYTYKAFGDPDGKFLVAVNDAKGNTTSYGRNILGSLTGITQGGISRTLHYNSKSFLDYETHPETGTINYTRDGVGNMKSRSDPEKTLYYTYDDVNRLTNIDASNDVAFTYDGAGNRTSMSSPPASISYTYDSANRLTEKTMTVSGVTYTTKYTYDGNDNITDIYYPTGLHVIYGYNSYNEVTSVGGFGGSVSSFSYNLAGQPTSFSYSNNKSTTITYNSRYFTQSIRSSGAIDIGYTYDSRGNTKKITNYPDSSKTQSFNYDDLDRLTGFSGAWGSGSFTYSSSGNRLSKNVAGLNTSYSYSNNRLSSASGDEAAAYSYYGSGNLKQLVESGVTYSLTYDDYNNLTEFSSGGSPLAQFEYDGSGMRVKKIASGKTIVYHYDLAGRVISETDESGVNIADYIYANGKLVAKVANDDDLITPVAPGNLSATAISSSQIDLSWTDNSDNETGFYIERKTGTGGAYAQIDTVGVNITGYSDTGLNPDTPYYYQIRAYNSIGESGYSNEANATTFSVTNPPAAPSDLSATAVSSSQIDISWTDNSDNETGFYIERKTGSGGTYAQIDTVGVNVTSYSDTGLNPDTPYYYQIRAYNSIGESGYSNEANATTDTGGNEIPITTDPSSQGYPDISGDRIVWSDNRNGNDDIYMYDILTHIETRITTNTSTQIYPAISGDRIVWMDDRNGPWNIYMYDPSTGETRISTYPLYSGYPAISGDRIVWEDLRNGNYDVYMYDISTGIETQITSDSSAQVYPAISGDRIVWEDYRNGNADIYMYDIATGIETQITSDSSSQVYPAISGDRIVWSDNRNGNDDIYMYDIATGIETQITSDSSSQYRPAISGDRIVWQDYRNSNADIYMYDISTGIETQITSDSAGQIWPSVSGNRIVWMDRRNGNYDIYMYTGDSVYTLTVNINGNGTVTSSPAGIDCGTDCTEPYEEGTMVTLTSVPDTGSIFTGWTGGGCSGTGDCTVTMSATTDITATFDTCSNPPVKIASAYYSSLQDAYNTAVDGDLIQSHAITFTENLNINRNISVTLDGGYDCDYTTKTGKTSLKGQMTISNGRITPKNLVLEK